MNQGWIKLHRKLLNNAVMKKSAYFHIWVTLLLKANHEPNEFIFNNEKTILNPGQLIIGRKELSKITRISQTTIERILKYLENGQQIGQQTTSKYRIITILNWQNYQIDGQQNGQQVDNKRTSSGQQADTNKNDKNEKNEKNYRSGCSDDSFKKMVSDCLDRLEKEGVFNDER